MGMNVKYIDICVEKCRTMKTRYNVALNETLGNIHCGGIPMSIAVQTDMATPALAR